MPLPTLTPEEIAQLEKELVKDENSVATFTASIPQKQARAAELAVADGAFKKFFDYYKDDIIGKYDSEYRALNGRYIIAPITEADVEGPANADLSVRTTPHLPATDMVRVPEFDGGGTATDPINETQHIADQAATETLLVFGFPSGGGFDPTSAVSNSSLSAGSTTVKVLDLANPLTIVIGDYFVVSDGTNLAIVQVTTVTDNMGGDPPYDFTYGITVIIPPSAPIPGGSPLSEFTGFSNGERSTKTAGIPEQQPLMDLLVARIQSNVNGRISDLNLEIAALNANQDADGAAQITTALLNANTSKTFLTNYLITTDISDTGLTTLLTERGVRGPQITTRVSQINANYTGQSKNYYNERYIFANNRGNTLRGTLRLQKHTEKTATTMQDYADSMQDAIDAINAILP